MGFPGGLDAKEFTCNVGDLGPIPGLGRSPGEGNSYPLQYSCLENSMDRAAWQATVHGATSSQTRPSKFHVSLGFSGASNGKESACSMEKLCSVPGSGRSLGEGNGNPLQYSCLENPMDGGAWWATVHGVAESDMTE